MASNHAFFLVNTIRTLQVFAICYMTGNKPEPIHRNVIILTIVIKSRSLIKAGPFTSWGKKFLERIEARDFLQENKVNTVCMQGL